MINDDTRRHIDESKSRHQQIVQRLWYPRALYQATCPPSIPQALQCLQRHQSMTQIAVSGK